MYTVADPAIPASESAVSPTVGRLAVSSPEFVSTTITFAAPSTRFAFISEYAATRESYSGEPPSNTASSDKSYSDSVSELFASSDISAPSATDRQF
ncbi:hypothetical protein B0I28_108252 [Glycomyces artemisiae]|uniref:Uncharacterized protein n=1 Tax=Glycomyces artemisiae TaxID=1076443 RepID=A0A2T0UG67_9ACTN|nr:hypothetical protein B0I28_108252 [Glycomyces artemisiae]